MSVSGQSAVKLGKARLPLATAVGRLVCGFIETVARVGVVGQRIPGKQKRVA